MIDYYKLMGVLPSANEHEIRQAYRRLASQHHPDRGGSHEMMVRLNEAWFVLSDPERRRLYDAVLSGSHNVHEEQWEAAAAAARNQSRDYARDWETFQAWMGHAMDDMAAAEHGTMTVGGITLLPSIRGSWTGTAALFIGGLAGQIIAINLGYFDSQREQASDADPVVKIAARFLPLFIGVWVGFAVHHVAAQFVANRTKPSTPPDSSNKRNVNCPKYGQAARIPRREVTLTVTCPNCREKFEIEPPAISPTKEARAAVPLALRTKWALITGLLTGLVVWGLVMGYHQYFTGIFEPLADQYRREILNGEVPEPMIRYLDSPEAIEAFTYRLRAADPSRRAAFADEFYETMMDTTGEQLPPPLPRLFLAAAAIGAVAGYSKVAPWVHRRRLRPPPKNSV